MMSFLWFVWRTNADRTLYMQTDRDGFMSTAQAVESTDKHVLYDKQALSHIDKQNNPRWLMTDVYSEKNAALPPSWEGKKNTLTNLDRWLCWLLVSVSPVAKPLGRLSLWCSIRAWGVISVALSQCCWLEQCCLTYSLLITLTPYPCSQMSLTIMISHHFHFSPTLPLIQTLTLGLWMLWPLVALWNKVSITTSIDVFFYFLSKRDSYDENDVMCIVQDVDACDITHGNVSFIKSVRWRIHLVTMLTSEICQEISWIAFNCSNTQPVNYWLYVHVPYVQHHYLVFLRPIL